MAANVDLSRFPIHYTDNDYICQFDKFSFLYGFTMYIGHFIYNFSKYFYRGRKDGQQTGAFYGISTADIRNCGLGIYCLFMVKVWVSIKRMPVFSIEREFRR